MTDRIGLGVLTRLVHRDLLDEVLADTGRTERRRRLLPARLGAVVQILSFGGLLIGLYLGAQLASITVTWGHSQSIRTALALVRPRWGCGSSAAPARSA